MYNIYMFSNPENNIEQFHIDPGMSVADLGSGAGFYSLALAKEVGPSGKVYSVDIQKELLSKLQTEAHNEGIANIKLVWGDLDEVGGSTLNDQSVDRVVIANVLFQVEDKDNLIKEAYRILKPGSKLLFVDWSDSFGGLGPRPQDVIKEDVAKTLFESEGFEFEKDIQTGDHHYGFIVKKK
jgi:ubiquinone/menaquinone biosynthesis C-methylase UbiE